MSLDIIQLPDFVLAELYKDSLVELENLQAPEIKKKVVAEEKVKDEPATSSPEPLKFLGQNKKHIVVLVDETKALFINENELDFLTKILTACNLNLADIAIVNTHKNNLIYSDLKEQLTGEYFLLLGVEPSTIKLPFNIPFFQVQPYNGSTFIYTPSLAGMLPNTQESKLLKSKLWVSLKTAFKL